MLLCGVAQCKVVDSEEVCHHHLQLFHSTSLANFLCDRKERIKVRQNVPLFVYIILCRIPLIRQKLILTSHLYLAKNLGQSRQHINNNATYERIAYSSRCLTCFTGPQRRRCQREGAQPIAFSESLCSLSMLTLHTVRS